MAKLRIAVFLLFIYVVLAAEIKVRLRELSFDVGLIIFC